MSKRAFPGVLIAWTVAFSCLAGIAWAAEKPSATKAKPTATATVRAEPFFPFCIDWHDAKAHFPATGRDAQGTRLQRRRPHLARQGRGADQVARCCGAEAVPDHNDRQHRGEQTTVRQESVQGSSRARQRPKRPVPSDLRWSKTRGQRRGRTRRRGHSRDVRPRPRIRLAVAALPAHRQLDSAHRRSRAHRRQSGSAQRRRNVQSLPLAARGQVARLQTAAPASHAATLGCLHQRRRRVRRQTRLEPLYPTARRRQLRCRDVLEDIARPRLQRPGRAAVLRHRRRRPRTPRPLHRRIAQKCRGPRKLPRA